MVLALEELMREVNPGGDKEIGDKEIVLMFG